MNKMEQLKESNENNIEMDISELNFKQLQEAREIGEKSLQRTERGFMTINGTEVYFKDMGEDTCVLINGDNIKELAIYILRNNDSILNFRKNKGIDKKVVIQELEKVLTSEEFGYRIIE